LEIGKILFLRPLVIDLCDYINSPYVLFLLH
jgi:hypothetical protein